MPLPPTQTAWSKIIPLTLFESVLAMSITASGHGYLYGDPCITHSEFLQNNLLFILPLATAMVFSIINYKILRRDKRLSPKTLLIMTIISTPIIFSLGFMVQFFLGISLAGCAVRPAM